ncbi:MAG: hypothetical protein ABIS07_14505 [Dokdonella sp.]
MSLTPFLIGLFAFAAVCALIALSHGVHARRHWRTRRRFAAGHRALWSAIFLLLALLGAFSGTVLLGYRRLAAEALVARLEAHALGPQHFALDIELPDGARQRVELSGDDWQLDAHVIKWDTRAVVLGAPALYRLDRITGRYRDIGQERVAPKSVAALSTVSTADLWTLKQRFPRYLPWVDADYGSAAYLPLVDGGRYTVTLAAAGGLIARASDAATAQKLDGAAGTP